MLGDSLAQEMSVVNRDPPPSQGRASPIQPRLQKAGKPPGPLHTGSLSGTVLSLWGLVLSDGDLGKRAG